MKVDRKHPLTWVTGSAMVGVAVLALAGCQTTKPASVKSGECRVFTAPEREIVGADQYSQSWADDTVEAGVAGCKWKRPRAAGKG